MILDSYIKAPNEYQRKEILNRANPLQDVYLVEVIEGVSHFYLIQTSDASQAKEEALRAWWEHYAGDWVPDCVCHGLIS